MNWPARTEAAIAGASMAMTNMSRATCRLPVMAASSRNTFPPFADRAHLDVARGGHSGLEERGGGVERGQARDAALDRRAPDLETILENRAAGLARFRVDVRHRVDDEVDLTLRDSVDHGRSFLADLGYHARREAGLLQGPGSPFRRDQRPSHLDEPRDNWEELGLVGVGDGQERGSAALDVHAGSRECFAESLVQRIRDADRLSGRLHLRTEVRVDRGQLVHREDGSFEWDQAVGWSVRGEP